jgi:uncharacterized membrane protein (DUF106 family)
MMLTFSIGKNEVHYFRCSFHDYFHELFEHCIPSRIFDKRKGVVVAKLPFEPFSLMRNITHRNIPGSDYTECSMIFIYILCNVVFRPVIQKILGFSGPRAISAQQAFPFAPPSSS